MVLSRWLTALVLLAPLVYGNQVVRTDFPHVSVYGKLETLPSPWKALGCYLDEPGVRTLQGANYASNTMSPNICIAFCSNHGFIFSGTEYAVKCSPPMILPSVGLWNSLGCYIDAPGRTLTTSMSVAGSMTVPLCTTACYNAGYTLAGTEYSAECFCGTQFSNGGELTSSGCTMLCAGNSSTFCGGPNRLNVYNYTGTPPPRPVIIPGAPTEPTPDTPPLLPITAGLAQGWSYAACYVDQAYGRIFVNRQPDSDNMTVSLCINSCVGAGYSVAGLEYSRECYCGNTLLNAAAEAEDSQCQMPCAGNATQPCGGPARASVYTKTGKVKVLPVATALKTGLPGKWTYKGCLRELAAGPRTLPYMNQWLTSNTVERCLKQCSDYGYDAAALTGAECWCGDVEDVTRSGNTFTPEKDCNIVCSGNGSQICGGPERVQLYQWAGELDTYGRPANKGRYEYLIDGPMVPLLATLGINDKVTFLEKFGTSWTPNSTGAYELDLALVGDPAKAWREMHVKTDVFCAASIILPDLKARQLDAGGWSNEATFGVRLYTPDGAPGVASKNDWEENPQTLRLQDGRWYPTALVMTNGSVLIVGGQKESNGAPVPSLEILPAPAGGRTVKFLDYLLRTDPWNLYPFLFVLPIYYNEARVLDKRSLDTVRVLPNIPGSVNNPLGGRSYPLEGAAMILPQSAPYTAPLTVLICGGSTAGAGIALDNCVTIGPEAKSPTWTIERMPSKRVMPCMVNLPDGTFMIMNGAYQGVAGFGLANDPNLSAVLYDPSKPLHSRMSVLANTTIARLYHSEATLLHDGRVLVSGSDPEHRLPDGTLKYPQETRIEVFLPPYLTDGTQRPTFSIQNTDWSYGGSYAIVVSLGQKTNLIRVSLIAATSSTHGNTMGSRTLFPTVSCQGTTCTITAPPNAGICPPGWFMLFLLNGPTPSVATWVRIGGDPARLGNWPSGPDFTRPGV